MHELSIAQRLVEMAIEHMQEARADTVVAVTVSIGALSCVHEDALQFGFDLVSQDTPLSGAALRIIKLPVMIYCGTCEQEFELPSIQCFQCPVCGTPSADIRQGRELDLQSIEVLSSGSAATESHHPVSSHSRN